MEEAFWHRDAVRLEGFFMARFRSLAPLA